MNKVKITIAALALIVPAVTLSASGKRGVGESQFKVKQQQELLAPGVKWWYNWGNDANKYFDGLLDEFVPMCWSGSYSADKIRTYVKNHPNTKYLLGFNEPNFIDQAHMTPQEAAEAWPAVQALAKELNLKLVGPAVNYSSWLDPFQWYRDFVNLVGKDAFDYVACHCYGGANLLKDEVDKLYEITGKPVWVTEFCWWPGGAGDVNVDPSVQISSMINYVQYLEQSDKVFRYAWFKPVGDYNTAGKPNYGLLKGSGYDRSLTPQGWVYTYMGDFDKKHYYPENEEIAAIQVVNQAGILMDKGNNPDCPSPIEISQLSQGGFVDYNFRTWSNGNYNLILKVSGKGEPARFDPKIGIYEVNADGSETELATPTTLTLSGDDAVYTEQTFSINLSSAKHTIRVKETGMGSGMRISTVKLGYGAGVEGVDNEAKVNIAQSNDHITAWGANVNGMKLYDLNGRTVAQSTGASVSTSGLSKGVYLVKVSAQGNNSITKKLVID